MFFKLLKPNNKVANVTQLTKKLNGGSCSKIFEGDIVIFLHQKLSKFRISHLILNFFVLSSGSQLRSGRS